jgi:hypothetical protein
MTEYSKGDVRDIMLRAAAVSGMADLLYDCHGSETLDISILASASLAIKTLIDPVRDFLEWAALYAELPENAAGENGKGES